MVDVLDATSLAPAALVQSLAERLRRAMVELRAAGELRVRIVADSEMTVLHATHKKDATTTDVLTFDLSNGSGGLDVDVVVCLDEAHRQAAARGHDAGDELLLYALHGALHCLGFDDASEDESARMHEEEDRVLNAIGVGAVFGRPVLDRGDAR